MLFRSGCLRYCHAVREEDEDEMEQLPEPSVGGGVERTDSAGRLSRCAAGLRAGWRLHVLDACCKCQGKCVVENRGAIAVATGDSRECSGAGQTIGAGCQERLFAGCCGWGREARVVRGGAKS